MGIIMKFDKGGQILFRSQNRSFSRLDYRSTDFSNQEDNKESDFTSLSTSLDKESIVFDRFMNFLLFFIILYRKILVSLIDSISKIPSSKSLMNFKRGNR